MLIVTFYWTVEKLSVKRWILALFPFSHRGRVHTVWDEIEYKIGGWARGQLLLMLIIVWVISALLAPVQWSVIDPRTGLAAGFRDAGEAISNLQLVASLPKPAGFFDPENPAGLPSAESITGAFLDLAVANGASNVSDSPSVPPLASTRPERRPTANAATTTILEPRPPVCLAGRGAE